MKKSSMTLLSLLTCTGAVCASPTTVTGPIQQGVYQFTQSNQLRSYKLCTYEMCQPNSEGVLATVRTSVGSVKDAVAMASDAEAENYLVFYPQGKEGDEYARRILRKRYLVELHAGVNLKDVKERCGIQEMAPFRAGSKYLVCEEESAGQVLKQLGVVSRDPGVKRVEPLFARQLKKDLVPDDTFYTPGGVGLGNPWGMSNEAYQWYLNNEGVNGAIADIDINVEGAWDTVTGAGVMVAVVDDGVLLVDPLLFPTELGINGTGPHQNFNDGFPGATLGASFFDTHGTQVAGLISSTFNDGFGMAGSAPASNFASIRLIAGPVDDTEIASALTWGLRGGLDEVTGLYGPDDIHIYSNSWSPGVDEPVLVQEGPLVLEALEEGATFSRGGLGAIYVWSAGNSAGTQDNSGYSSMQASQYTIAVGAIGDTGTKAGYSEPGANLVVSAPSGGGAQSVLTSTYTVGVDADGFPVRVPGYTDTFSGTSASAPLVSGVVALMLQANPGLGWRDVQDILIRTATLNNDVSGEWLFNGAGLHFNHNYGAGLVNAEAAVAAATDRIATGNLADRDPAISESVFTPGGEIIPDGDGSGVTKVFELGGDPNMRIEHVEVKLTAITKRRADFNITLISPSGTPSVLARSQEDNDDEESITDFVFMTTRNWGEGSAGEWLLRITDVKANGIQGTFNDATLTVHGVLDPDAPISTGPVLVSDQAIVVREGDFIDYLIEARNVNEVVVGDLPLGLVYNPATGKISGIAGEAGIYSLPITLIGDSGTREVGVSLIVVPIAGALGGAVEQDLPTYSGGDVPWDLELVKTFDGQDAVRSGAGMANGEDSVFGFSGIPNGVAVFEWAVSSQSYSTGNPDPITGAPIRSDDRLWFNLGGTLPQQWAAFIDGERSFGREVLPLGTVAVPMTNGSNSPRWTYRKDALYSAGQDAGFVDRVRFIDTKTYLDDVRRAGNINFDFEFTSKTWWLPFEFPIGSPPTDSDPADNPPRELLKTSSVGNGQRVTMAAWIEGPGSLSYRVSVSTEENDVFEFLMDGAPRNTIGGAETAEDFTQEIPEGTHYVEFRYSKDFNLDGNNDFVLLDNIIYTPTSTALNWEAGYGVSLPPAEDFDRDGYSNHIEFIFGGNPTVADVPAGYPQFARSEDGSYLEYGLDLKLKDYDLIPQQSSDLENWVDISGATKDRTVDSVEYYRVSIGGESGEDRLYYRVMVNPKQEQ